MLCKGKFRKALKSHVFYFLTKLNERIIKPTSCNLRAKIFDSSNLYVPEGH